MSMIAINKLNFSYDDRKILDNVSFKIKIPSMISIIGSNNSGKTTLIKCISGVLPIDDCISIDDIEMNKKNKKKYARKIGVVFSRDHKQFLFEKVMDEVTFPLYNLNYSKKSINNAVNEVKELLFLNDILEKKVNELNDMERIKVLLATAIIHSPEILLLDDVFLGLSNENKEKLMLLLKRLIKEKNMIVISTTSSLSDTIYSDAILVMDQGSIRYSGRLSDILEHDNTLTKIGIDIPVMMDMSLKLKFYNLLDKVILDAEEMVDELWD